MVVSTKEKFRVPDANRTCVTLFSTLNVIAVPVTAIRSSSSDQSADFLPLLSELVDGSGVGELIVNR